MRKSPMILLGFLFITLAVIVPNSAMAAEQLNWAGNGAQTCSGVGAHWILSPNDNITSATLYVDGVAYPMTQSGQGSWAADSSGSPVVFGTTEVYVIYTASGPTSPSLNLKLSHCLGCSTNLDCDDSNVCTDDTCNVATGICEHTNNSSPCDDGNACTTGDVCSGGSCVAGPPPNCDDNNGCTDDSCDSALGCVHTNNTAPCDDGSACTTGDVCSAGSCQPGTPLVCDDQNGCTDDSCDAAIGCVFTNNTAPCDDGNACTTGDVCSAGSCQAGTPLVCNDNNVCTNDSCNPALGCVYTPNTNPCDDGNACTTNDTCAAGSCVGGPPPNCDDSNICTNDSCVPATGCVHENNTSGCDDHNACTVGDVCIDGTCTPGTGHPNCDDGRLCTNDTCDPATGCVNTDKVCTPSDPKCQDGACNSDTGNCVFTAKNPPPLGCGEGCTPGFWKNNVTKKGAPAWPSSPTPNTKISAIFTSITTAACASQFTTLANSTLLQGLSFQGGSTLAGGAQILLRAGIAAYLNAVSNCVKYPLSAADVVSAVNAALESCDRTTIINAASYLDTLNNAFSNPDHCPLNQAGQCSHPVD